MLVAQVDHHFLAAELEGRVRMFQQLVLLGEIMVVVVLVAAKLVVVLVLVA
jgi:hypothetical protein